MALPDFVKWIIGDEAVGGDVVRDLGGEESRNE